MPTEELREAQERIRRFERLGGVNLSRLEPEEKHDLLAEVRTGVALHKKAVFRFQCPMCGNIATNDQDLAPLCTGPNWTDDHPHEPMQKLPDLF